MKSLGMLLLFPLLFACQKYNKPSYDNNEKKLRELSDTVTTIPLDNLWPKRDSLTYLKFKNIKLMYMEIDSIPNWVGEYHNLTFLSTTVDKRKFKFIPKSIGNLRKLVTLNLSHGEIKDLPQELYTLKQLQSLYLDDNKISNISKNIGNMVELKSLHLRDNPIIFLPSEICMLYNLKSLILENTKIKILPKCIGNLPNLDWINISGTQLTEFPIEILNAPKLTTVDAKGLVLKNYKEVKSICEKKNITFYYDEKK